MSVLTYLADTNVLSAWLRREQPVTDWLKDHPNEVAISTLTVAELRRGIELKPPGKVRRTLEREFQFILEDYDGAIWVFDEAAAMEWGRLMAEARHHPIPFGDSLIGAIARVMDD